MDASLLEILRCPYCGTSLSVVEGEALVRDGRRIERGVLGCECCAYPVIEGIPVLIADESTRRAMHALEAGRPQDALLDLLGTESQPLKRERVRALVDRHDATYREALELLCEDAEGAYFFHRLSDPTHVTIEALVRALAQARWPVRGRILDLCGGSGHLTRVLATLRTSGGTPEPGAVLADVHFWKLWLASRFVAPAAAPVCCDANHPLPFARDTFSTVLLADAFPYIWHKRLLSEEMMRLAGEDGVVVMPHLHSALGENFSAGDTLTPGAYASLLALQGPRLFSDARLFEGVVEQGVVDLARDVSAEELGTEASLTLVASRRPDLFRRYVVPEEAPVIGALMVNPLYRLEQRGASTELTLAFPTPEYEAEFGACRRYMPEHVTLPGDLTRGVSLEALGSRVAALRAQRVLLDAPVRYA
jgi:uncharacterized protein YbaR (Trm112 family)/SAM-dependent methyltransferase